MWYDIPGVDLEPEVADLRDWTIITHGDKSILFGYRSDGSWRKSSYIVKIEGEGDNLEITTFSGRVYKLREQDKIKEGTPLEVIKKKHMTKQYELKETKLNG